MGTMVHWYTTSKQSWKECGWVHWCTTSIQRGNECTQRPWVLVLLPTAHASSDPAVARLIDAGDTEGARKLEESLATNVSRSAPGRAITCPVFNNLEIPTPDSCDVVSAQHKCNTPLFGYPLGY